MADRNTISLHKLKIAQTFNRASQTYADASMLEKEIGARLLERLDFIKCSPTQILDLGGGTGFFSKALSERYPSANLYNLDLAEGLLKVAEPFDRVRKLCADADNLPLKTNSIDFVFSNSVIHWLEDVNVLFKEIHRVLKPNGLFLFSTLGPDTLQELRESFFVLDEQRHVNLFMDMHHIGDVLMRTGFLDPVMDREILTYTYSTVFKLIRDLKSSGSSYVFRKFPFQFSRKILLKEISKIYETFKYDTDEFPATIEVIYGHAVIPQVNQNPNQHLYRIPIANIQRMQA